MKVAVGGDGQKWLHELRRADDLPIGYGGGDASALRAYQAYHPNAAIHYVSFGGRTFWLTGTQLALWYQIMRYKDRGKRTTLEAMAVRAMCSKATVSRFLKRLDLWRVVDVATMRGRYGGTYVLTIHMRNDEADANLSGARHTYASRKIARERIAQAIKRLQLNRLKVALVAYRLPPRKWYARMGGGWLSTEQLPLTQVSTDATLK